jgi:hypothetical protein
VGSNLAPVPLPTGLTMTMMVIVAVMMCVAGSSSRLRRTLDHRAEQLTPIPPPSLEWRFRVAAMATQSRFYRGIPCAEVIRCLNDMGLGHLVRLEDWLL